MNQKQLAKRLGVTQRQIRKWYPLGLPYQGTQAKPRLDAEQVVAWLIDQGLGAYQGAAPSADPPLPGPIVVETQAEVASALSVNRRTVVEWFNDGCPGRPGPYNLEAIRAWVDANRGTANNGAGAARLIDARAENLRIRNAEGELRLAEKAGDLISSRIATRTSRRALRETVEHLEQLPDTVDRELRGTIKGAARKTARALVVAACDAMRANLAYHLEQLAEQSPGVRDDE